MKIETIRLKNFRSHVDTEFQLNRINIFRGPHGTGKSSIQKAIDFALTGRCDQTDARGSGAEALITLGKTEMAVSLDLGGAILTRSRNRAGGQVLITGNGKSLAGKGAEAAIEANCGSPEILGAALNSHRFCRMSEKEQKALLAAALASDPVPIEPHVLDAIRSLNHVELSKDIASASEADMIHERYFKLRADAKRDLKAMGALQEPEIPADCPDEQQVTEQIQYLETRKAELTKQRTQACQKVTESNATKRSEYTTAKAKLDAARKTVAEMGAWCIDSSEEIARLQKQLRNRTEAGKYDKLIAENQGRRAALRQERTQLEAPVQKACPTCARDYENLPDHSARLAAIEKEATELDVALQELQDKRNKLPNFEEIQRKLDRHQMAVPKVVAAESVIKEIGELTEPAYGEADTSALNAEITDLTQRIANGREIEKSVIRYQEQRKQYEAAKQKRAGLEQTIGKLETLVAYFGPTGPIKAKLIGGKLPAFVARMNGVLQRFGFSVDFDLEPYNLKVEIGSKQLTLAQLSESEEYRFGIAFCVALAEATGVGMVVIDRADMLLPDVRSTLTETLLDSNLEQIFLLAAGEPMDSFPEVPDTTFFELQNVDGVTSIRAQHKPQVRELTYDTYDTGQ